MKFIGVPIEKAGIYTGDCLAPFDAASTLRNFKEQIAKMGTTATTTTTETAETNITTTKAQEITFSDKLMEVVFLGTGCSASSPLRNG